MAVRPGDFDFGRLSPDGSGWEIDGEYFAENPKYLLGPNDYEMLRLWRMFQGGVIHFTGPMSAMHGDIGSGLLPEAGGVMDQAAVMLDAFAFMTALEAKIKGKN